MGELSHQPRKHAAGQLDRSILRAWASLLDAELDLQKAWLVLDVDLLRGQGSAPVPMVPAVAAMRHPQRRPVAAHALQNFVLEELGILRGLQGAASANRSQGFEAVLHFWLVYLLEKCHGHGQHHFAQGREVECSHGRSQDLHRRLVLDEVGVHSWSAVGKYIS